MVVSLLLSILTADYKSAFGYRGAIHALARIEDEAEPASQVARKPEDDERVLYGEIDFPEVALLPFLL